MARDQHDRTDDDTDFDQEPGGGEVPGHIEDQDERDEDEDED